MPGTARASVGGMCYHILNRGNGRSEVFHKNDDYAAFLKLLCQANERVPMRMLAHCLMPDHFHLVVWPLEDGDLGRWMHWLLTSHVRQPTTAAVPGNQLGLDRLRYRFWRHPPR